MITPCYQAELTDRSTLALSRDCLQADMTGIEPFLFFQELLTTGWGRKQLLPAKLNNNGSKAAGSIFGNCDFSTPVLILKCFEDSYIGLGIVRSLGRLGVPVYSIVNDTRAPANFSRYGKTLCFPNLTDHTSDEQLLEYLAEASDKLGRKSVLIPTTDLYARFVSRRRTILEKSFLFQECNPDLVNSLCSKQSMHALASGHDVPTAKTFVPTSLMSVHEYIKGALFPLVVKAVDWTQTNGRPSAKSIIMRSSAELIKNGSFNNSGEFPNIMLQEYIGGSGTVDWMFNGYFDHQSNCLFYSTGKKLRQAPIYTGYSTLGECSVNQVVHETSVKFLRDIGYRGIVDIDYRYDPRDELYKILDVNPRVGATFRLFAGRCGLDVVRAMYLDVTGQKVPDDSQVDGRKWIVEDSDLRSAYEGFRNGDFTLRSYLGSFRGVREGAWMAFDDPSPSLMRIWQHLSSKILEPKNYIPT